MGLMGSCAQISSPTGGERDENPPVVVASDPAPNQTHLSPSVLRLSFDEFIQVKNASTEMFLSPPLLGQPLETRIRGKQLEVAFPAMSSWEDNTTYVLHFGASVVDLHEGNPADGLLWAFSTGEQLDTLAIHGQVLRALDRKPVPGCRIMAYSETDSLNSLFVEGSRPRQVAVTDAQGQFVVRHLSAGRYRLLAVEDDNRNYLWNPGESAGLVESLVEAGDTLPHRIWMSPTPGAFQGPRVSFAEQDSLGFVRMFVERGSMPGSPSEWTQAVYDWSDSSSMGPTLNHLTFEDSMWVWSHMPSWRDTVVWHWQGDVAREGWDTLRIRDARVPQSKSPKLLSSRPWAKRSFAQSSRVMNWDHPLQAADTARMLFYEDTVALENWRVALPDFRSLAWIWPEKPGQRFSMELLPAAVMDIWGRPNADTLRFEWATHESDHAGNLMVNVQNLARPGWLGNTALKDSIYCTGDTLLVWSELSPGRTTLTFSVDENCDGQWGNTQPEEWRPAESRWILQEGIQIRSNWDVELSVDFGELPLL